VWYTGIAKAIPHLGDLEMKKIFVRNSSSESKYLLLTNPHRAYFLHMKKKPDEQQPGFFASRTALGAD
jgi:hypothetical protein